LSQIHLEIKIKENSLNLNEFIEDYSDE